MTKAFELLFFVYKCEIFSSDYSEEREKIAGAWNWCAIFFYDASAKVSINQRSFGMISSLQLIDDWPTFNHTLFVHFIRMSGNVSMKQKKIQYTTHWKSRLLWKLNQQKPSKRNVIQQNHYTVCNTYGVLAKAPFTHAESIAVKQKKYRYRYVCRSMRKWNDYTSFCVHLSSNFHHLMSSMWYFLLICYGLSSLIFVKFGSLICVRF